MVDNKNGSFDIVFVPSRAGDYLLHMVGNGKNYSVPFPINVPLGTENLCTLILLLILIFRNIQFVYIYIYIYTYYIYIISHKIDAYIYFMSSEGVGKAMSSEGSRVSWLSSE